MVKNAKNHFHRVWIVVGKVDTGLVSSTNRTRFAQAATEEFVHHWRCKGKHLSRDKKTLHYSIVVGCQYQICIAIVTQYDSAVLGFVFLLGDWITL